MNLRENDKDTSNSTAITGRYKSIPVNPGEDVSRPTFAAGALMWRGDPADPEVAVIHRPGYDDWSLPKGKLDPGENLPGTAAREILEETGYTVRLGKLLGSVSYPVARRTKLVWYWTAEVIHGEFEANSEVDEMRWVSLDEAEELLSYDLDVEVLKKGRKRLSKEPDTRIIYVRHGRAHQRKNWSGCDDLRPLDKKGRRQAEFLTTELLPFAPERVYAALPDRCRDTVAPLASEIGTQVMVEQAFGDDAWQTSPDRAREKFREVIAQGGVSVICAQGLVMPELLSELAEESGLPLKDGAPCKKGCAWVLGFREGKLLTADYYATALPVK